jgi:NAD(P)H-hydrate repair Nnr-like enzyme with NAD(P)H-hydrate epimerase domain
LTGIPPTSYRDLAMEILTARQMRRVDQRAIRERGIPLELRRPRGGGLRHARRSGLASRQVVLCGKGEQRRRARRGSTPCPGRVTPRIILLAGEAIWDPRRTRAGAPGRAGRRGVEDDAAWARGAVAPGADAVVVDAILGTGVRGGARGLAASVIEAIGAWAATIVSIDLPSGADADSGALPGPVVRAHRTYTLCRPKAALVLEPAASHAGPWRVIDIGIPDDAVEAEAVDLSG